MKPYSLGVEHYITKPINRLEVVSVLKKVSDYLLMENSLHDIQKSLSNLYPQNQIPKNVEPEPTGPDPFVYQKYLPGTWHYW